MNAQSVLDAAALVASASAATAIAVQLVVSFLGIESPRAKVGTAVLVAAVLTFLYAFSSGLLTAPNAYALAIASLTIAASGAGTQHAVTSVAAAPKAGA